MSSREILRKIIMSSPQIVSQQPRQFLYGTIGAVCLFICFLLWRFELSENVTRTEAPSFSHSPDSSLRLRASNIDKQKTQANAVATESLGAGAKDSQAKAFSSSSSAMSSAPPPQIASSQDSGEIVLSDFRLVIPAGWKRRPDWEETGPGTKLFLEGPHVGAGQLYIGIDVYPLPQGMNLQEFIQRYSANWAGLRRKLDKPATLCNYPARMMLLSDGTIDKLFVLCVRHNRGFAIGMFGPSGQHVANVKAFRTVLDTFQFFED